MLYLRYAKKDMNEAQFVKYRSKYQNENKIVDISDLPPCRSVLLLHSKRPNYVASVWKRSLEANFELPNISDHGWDKDANVYWIEELFPKDTEEILISDKQIENEVNGDGTDTF